MKELTPAQQKQLQEYFVQLKNYFDKINLQPEERLDRQDQLLLSLAEAFKNFPQEFSINFTIKSIVNSTREIKIVCDIRDGKVYLTEGNIRENLIYW